MTKIYVVGSSKTKFLPLDDIREKFLVDVDHDGDNIDSLNPWYSELTGMYYLWKHCNDDIVGLEHYRRYFTNDNGTLLSDFEIRGILKKNDVIMFRSELKQNAMEHMTMTGKRNELALGLAVVQVNFGKDMANYFKTNFIGDHIYLGNMFICRKGLANMFFDFIFNGVLKDFDEIHKFKRPRIDGYICEYFMEPWFRYNGFRIYDAKRTVFDKTLTDKLPSWA